MGELVSFPVPSPPSCADCHGKRYRTQSYTPPGQPNVTRVRHVICDCVDFLTRQKADAIQALVEQTDRDLTTSTPKVNL